uniref:Ubiquitin-like domain-containing protein n=1 Tax=Peronospora matthiolae TaxID=2874970 RepID=A0AAV1TMQ5_9STRA
MGPYIRVKRRNQTVFLDVQPTESFRSVKEKIGVLFHLPPTSIQLWDGLNEKESKEFADGATLADHEVQNDAVVYMRWKKENSDEWEELSVAKVEALDAGDSSRSTAGSGSGGIGANSVS